MMRRVCDEIAEKLLDYADGALEGREAEVVARHVEECEVCRARVDALRRSLELARVVWEDAEAELGRAGELRRRGRAGRRLRVLVAGVAGVAAVVVLAVGLWWGPRPTSDAERLATGLSGGVTPADVELQVARVGLAVEMLAAADALAEQAGGTDWACERYRYITAAYVETEAAKDAQARLQSLCDGRIEQ